MVELLRAEANQDAVSIRTDVVADLPKITADRVQLRQVFMNLILNAIEATKETGGILTVKTQLGENGQLLISVSDTGVGLPKEKLLPPSPKAAAWDYLSAAPLWSRTEAVCGPPPTRNEVQPFISPCRSRPPRYQAKFIL
jgi:Histidine kinase-, DNA gyrase B-, and HSP90-like ATPase